MKQYSNNSFIKKGGQMILTLTIIFVCISIFVAFLWIYSPGKVLPYLDENGKPIPGSISEKIFVNINGAEQGMFIKGKNASNPILLYLHGGMPDYFLAQKYPTGLEEIFTVVWWEQRGSGISYDPDMPQESITPDQMISDTKELTNYLRKRFGKEKIFLMGHSGGTFIGIQVAASAPELYNAYIGVAQMSDQLKSEKQAYEYMLKKYRENGNDKMLKKLEATSVIDNTPLAYLKLRDIAMHDLGIGTMHDMKSVITGIFLPSWACRDYTLFEKFNLWRGKSNSGVSQLWDIMLTTDLGKQITKLDIPVYFLHGIYDYTVSYSLSKEYFNKLQAPVKGFYTFDHSAHSPIFEEPLKVKDIVLNDIMNGKANLTDNN